MNPRSQARPTSWSDLTDEARWKVIANDRERVRAAMPRAVPEAIRLVAPVAVLIYAAQALKAEGLEVRDDVLTALAAHVTKVCACLNPAQQNVLVAHVEHLNRGCARHVSSARGYLYASAAALVQMIDDGMFPPDAPGSLAALAIKADAEETDAEEWGAHAKMHLGAAGRIRDCMVLATKAG